MADLQKMSNEELIEELARIEKLDLTIEEYKETHPIEFIQFFPHQERALDFINAMKKIILLQGANQIGKTVFGACVVAAACFGIQPWDGRKTVFHRMAIEKAIKDGLTGELLQRVKEKAPPVKVRILCQDWDKHAKEVIVPELKRWIPLGTYTTERNNLSVDYKWTFQNGSTLELICNSQETRYHEGWKGDLVWADEPPDRDKYVANKRGLISREGVFLLTMTAVTKSWVLDDIVLNSDPGIGCVTEVPQDANPTLTESALESFASTLNENDKLTRVQGKWLNLTGRIWPEFDRDLHIVDDFEVPPDWPVVVMIDCHTAKPHAVSYYAIDPSGVWYGIDESFDKGQAQRNPEYLADEIIRRKMQMGWRIENAFIDPLSKGDTQYIKHRGIEVDDTFSTISRKLMDHSIMLEVASKDKASGIRKVSGMLKNPGGRPAIYWVESLRTKIPNGILWEIPRWVYDENDEPIKENDHFCENLYRLSLTGIVYRKPVQAESFYTEPAYNPLDFGFMGARA